VDAYRQASFTLTQAGKEWTGIKNLGEAPTTIYGLRSLEAALRRYQGLKESTKYYTTSPKEIYEPAEGSVRATAS
jgi:hypothetical protein